MSAITERASKLARNAILASCSIGALLAAPGVSLANGSILPDGGHLQPFFSITASGGHLQPFFAVTADGGHLQPFTDGFSANINTVYGETPLFAQINPFGGHLQPFGGHLQPFGGHLQPFDTAATAPQSDLYTGTTNDAFWGANRDVTYWDPAAGSMVTKTVAFNPFTWTPSTDSTKRVGNLSYVQYGQIAGFWNSETAGWTNLWSQWAAAQANNKAVTGAAPSNAATDFKSLATALQTHFFGQSGTANTPNASLSTFWANEVASHTGNETYQTVVANEIYKILKPYGAVARTDEDRGVISIDLTSAANIKALAQATAADQALLYSNVYDRMMDYAGTDHVDWWMAATNWTPNLARLQSSGTASTTFFPALVGLIDFTVNGSGQHQGGMQGEQGSDGGDGTGQMTNGHGAAVYSLIKGAPITVARTSSCSLWQTALNYCASVAGVAQRNTYVYVYDPYDATQTTSFLPTAPGNTSDIADAIVALASTAKYDSQNARHPLGVINASLGVNGWTLNSGWNDALNYATSKGARNSYILVTAAGNDGSTQTVNVPWTYATNPKLLIVGSFGLSGDISTFSNRPGEACLYDTAVATNSASTPCVETNKLKYRTVLAPGEAVLVSDGAGSTTRYTGTSLAAPIVTGAVALIQERWNWLGPQYVKGALVGGSPDIVSNIILQTATPMGTRVTTGKPDPVYGMGLVNIQAANSPIDWNKLAYTVGKTTVTAGVATTTYSASTIAQVKQTVSSGTQSTFNAQGLYVTALEFFDGKANVVDPTNAAAVATATVARRYRDFNVPLASSLVGQRVGGQGYFFQDYLNPGLIAWSTAAFARTTPLQSGMTGFMQTSVPAGQVAGMDMRLAMSANAPTYGYREGNTPIRTDLALVGRNTSLQLGFGQGAAALNPFNGFNAEKDLDVIKGGANPMLALASGGAYVNYRAQLMHGVALTAGVTQRRDVRDAHAFGLPSGVATGASAYEASAENLGADISVTPSLVIHASLTALKENTGLLGMQSANRGDLAGGSTTRGATFGFDWSLPQSITLTASSTLMNTRTSSGQALITGAGGVNSSAAQIAMTKVGLFSGNDRLRLTLSRPMQIDSGRLHYQTTGVVDRVTGELGMVDQSVSAATSHRPLAAEGQYSVLLPHQGGELQAFVRAEANDHQASSLQPMNYTAGGRIRLPF